MSKLPYLRAARSIIVSVYILAAAGCSPGNEAARTETATQSTRTGTAPSTHSQPVVNDGTWVASASTTENNFRPELAVDQNPDTRWSSEFSDDQWWQVDFGQAQTLHNIELIWEDAYAATYRITTSSDGRSWDVAHNERSGSPGKKKISFEPRTARYVKIECGRRGTDWGFSLLSVRFNVPPAPPMTASASSGAGDYSPQYAIDGDLTTRWSSHFNDGEWWQVEFDEPKTVSGMRILWETAFSEIYDVAASDNGHTWRTIYSVTEGDGQTDILLFEPVRTKFLRIVCHQRGTGWGNSIWNIEFMDDSHAIQVQASSTAAEHHPEQVIDGRTNTFWKSADDGEQWVELQFPAVTGLGGLVLQWGENHAVTYAVEWSDDGKEWIVAHQEHHGTGDKDHIFFPAIDARHLRIVAKTSRAGAGYELALIELKSRDAQATPLREYQARARNAEAGRYPMWLTRVQEFWTVTGMPGDDQESLLGETGTFEPFKGAFSVQPFILTDGELHTWANVSLDQSLEHKFLPLPSVTWTSAAWKMDVAALTFGKPGAAFTAVRYRMANTTGEPLQGALVLAIRPVQLNPIWQNGGMSRIETAECETYTDSAAVLINKQPGILLPSKPSAMGASALADGDVNDYLAQGLFPADVKASEPEGKVGVGVRYDLDIPARAHRDVVVIYPLHDRFTVHQSWIDNPSGTFEGAWNDVRAAWLDVLNEVSIDIPEPRLIETMKSNLGYVLINHDAPWFKPGPRNYNHSWIRDGALTGVATLRMGLTEPVRAFIEQFSKFVNEDGWVPYIITEDGRPIGYNPDMDGGEGHEFDSQGQFVYIVRQYYDFTGDTELVRSVYPIVLRALEYGREIRKRRLTDEYKNTVYWGILPHSNSHEGYFPAKHSYWDNFWMLRGLKDGAYLAEQMGDRSAAAWIRAEETDLRKCLLDSINKVIARDNLAYIPGCAELGDEDPTSTSIAIMACDEADHLPQSYVRQTFERYQSRVARRHAGTPDTFTPYEVRNADVFIRLGQRDRALAMFRHFMTDSMKPHNWNHMAEVVHERPRAPSYIGDMPHTWVGSDYINAVRSMFSYVKNDTLVLAAGIDPVWLTSGIRVNNLPTQYGVIAYTMRQQDDTVTFAAKGELNPPNGFILSLPESLHSMRATVNNTSAKITDGAIHFSRLPVTVKLEP